MGTDGNAPDAAGVPDEPSGDVAVQSDRTLPSLSVIELQPCAEADRTVGVAGASPSAPAAGVNAPTALGRYAIRHALGVGGFGSVYLGHDAQLDRLVAIKVLEGGGDARHESAAQFLQEARRLAQLSHHGIVTVHDVGLDEGRFYIVSDYLDGPDLGRWLRDHRPAWPEAGRIAAAVADALAHAHSRLIVHRDVKPANIILTPDRGPVLVDFGLGLDERRAGGSELGVVSGTPAYMAPEQIAGEAHRIDGRTDIYSLGVVLYEMLCGQTPFRASDTDELRRQIRDDEPQPPRQLRREIPPELERVCLRALAKRLQDRYTTAADFAEDLRRACQPCVKMDIAASSSVVSTLVRPEPLSVAATPSALKSASARRQPREAERRQVTILACGCALFDSEAYLDDLDAEDQARLLRAFRQHGMEAMRRFDGSVVQCNEEALVACFGYPAAYEDAASRATLAGLELLDDLAGLPARLGMPALALNPWIGIHTGPAVVETRDESISLVGEARNVAVRLGDFAESGRIVCSAATHRLIHAQFECAGLGPLKVKGVAQPVELFQVLGRVPARSPIDAVGPAELTPLTGRDLEVGLLENRWERAREGTGHVVLLIGEPGLGKSRLVHTLKQHVLGQVSEPETQASVIEWRCSPHYQNTGLYPAVDFFARTLAFGGDEAPEARFDRLLAHLEQADLARPETVPLWAALLSLPAPAAVPPLALSAARQREETFRALQEWLHARAERGPVLFVVEDLHWVDASTLEFLGQFIAEGVHDSILTVLTFRPEFRTPWPALAHQTSLALNRLTRRQVGDLMRQSTRGPVPDTLIDQMYDRTGGVPLFVEEFTRMVQESGALAQAEQYREGAGALPARAIPATLQDLVAARLDRMEGEREVAQLCAVLGREFSHELLAAVADLHEATLQAKLARLAQAEILYPKGRPPRCSYIFKHALLEVALYNALVKDRRQQLHRRIAEVLEARFPQTVETEPELLAYHFTEAGLPAHGARYWLRAGLRARERAADREAIEHLTAGLSLMEAMDSTHAHDTLRLKLLTSLGPAYIAVRGYAAPEVGPILLRAGDLCQRIGDEPQRFGILLGRCEWHLVRGDVTACAGLAAEGIALAERLDDPGMRMEALFMQGATLFYRGRFAEARACHETALAQYDDLGRTGVWTAYTGHYESVTHRCYLALTLWHLGFPDQARARDREAQALARTLGHAFTLSHALDFSAFLGHDCRLGPEVEAAAVEESRIAAEHGFQLWRGVGTLHKGAGLLLGGRREEAMPLLLEGFSAFQATGARLRTPAYLGLLSAAYTQLGRLADARRALDAGLAVAAQNDDRSHEAELHRLAGELVLAESPDQTPAAEECFHRAIAVARTQQSKAWELRATLSLARLCHQQGRRTEAHAALAAVYGTFTEGFTTPDLIDAAALLQILERPA